MADQFDRSLADVHTALAYYHEHPEEMRQLRRERTETDAVALQEGDRGREPTDEELRGLGIDPDENETGNREPPDVLE